MALTGALLVGDSAWAESEIYGYVGPDGTFEMTNGPTDQRFQPAELQVCRPPRRVSVAEVEEAVERCAERFHIPPALLLAVLKAESDFNPTVISRARAIRR